MGTKQPRPSLVPPSRLRRVDHVRDILHARGIWPPGAGSQSVLAESLLQIGHGPHQPSCRRESIVSSHKSARIRVPPSCLGRSARAHRGHKCYHRPGRPGPSALPLMRQEPGAHLQTRFGRERESEIKKVCFTTPRIVPVRPDVPCLPLLTAYLQGMVSQMPRSGWIVIAGIPGPAVQSVAQYRSLNLSNGSDE